MLIMKSKINILSRKVNIVTDYRTVLLVLKLLGIDIFPGKSRGIRCCSYLMNIFNFLMFHLFYIERLFTFIPIIIIIPAGSKLFLAFLVHNFVILCLWNSVNCKKKKISHIIYKVQILHQLLAGGKYRRKKCFYKFIRFITLGVCVMPIAYGIGEMATLLMIPDFYLYTWKIDKEALHSKLILFARGFLASLQRDTFCGVVCFLYVLICWKIRECFIDYTHYLKKTISRYTFVDIPEQFLTKYIAILDAVEGIDNKLSEIILVLTIDLVLSLFSLMACSFGIADKPLPAFALLHIFVTLITSATYLILLIIMAAQIPVEMKRNANLCHKFYEEILQRPLKFKLASTQVPLLKLIMRRKIITLSGCHIVYFNRSLLLTLIGTLITYGLLIMNFQ